MCPERSAPEARRERRRVWVSATQDTWAWFDKTVEQDGIKRERAVGAMMEFYKAALELPRPTEKR